MNSRKLRRKQELTRRKEAKKVSKQVSKALSSMPETCGECGTVFDRTNKENLDQWRIAVYDDGRVHLACPDCVPEDVKKQLDS